jgi:hypothetical protein
MEYKDAPLLGILYVSTFYVCEITLFILSPQQKVVSQPPHKRLALPPSYKKQKQGENAITH